MSPPSSPFSGSYFIVWADLGHATLACHGLTVISLLLSHGCWGYRHPLPCLAPVLLPQFQTNFSLHIYLSTWSFAGKEKDGDVDSWVWSVLLESWLWRGRSHDWTSSRLENNVDPAVERISLDRAVSGPHSSAHAHPTQLHLSQVAKKWSECQCGCLRNLRCGVSKNI